MKTISHFLLTALLLLAVNFSFAQSKTEWKEQKEFHQVMSKTFHPAEEGNYAPIKARSAELAQKAEAWRNAEIPADIADKDKVKKTLKKLAKDSKKLDKSIKKGISDEELKTKLTDLHETFHTIVGLCRAKDEHHDEH